MPTPIPTTRKGAVSELPWTGDGEADRLNAADPLALLIGFVLDQQVTVQKAFAGPRAIRDRLGTLDAARLAAMDPGTLRAAFATPPAIHRFPGSMAERVQSLCSLVVERYGGDAAAVWRDASSGDDLYRRLQSLPGFGPMKARTVLLVLARLFGVRPPGWEAYAPDHMTLADADTAEKLAEYQAGKRAYKAQLRAQGMESDGTTVRPARRVKARR